MPDEQQKDPFAPQASELPNVSEPEVATYIRNEPQANLLARERSPYAERYTDHGEGSMIPDRFRSEQAVEPSGLRYHVESSRIGKIPVTANQIGPYVSVDEQHERVVQLLESVLKDASNLRGRLEPVLGQPQPTEESIPPRFDDARSALFNRFVNVEERLRELGSILMDINVRLEV